MTYSDNIVGDLEFNCRSQCLFMQYFFCLTYLLSQAQKKCV
jgi:hypothetical protein